MSGLDEQRIESEVCPSCHKTPREFRIRAKRGYFWWIPRESWKERSMTYSIVLDNGGQIREEFVKKLLPIESIECLACNNTIYPNSSSKKRKFFEAMARAVERELSRKKYYTWIEWTRLGRR